MELTDYDMKRFADIVAGLKRSPRRDFSGFRNEETKTYFSDDTGDDTSYCAEYGFGSVKELYECFDRFFSGDICDPGERNALIRACIAACYKYKTTGFIPEGDGSISEFIYEF